MKGAMGAAPNPVCWDGRRARGFGELVPSIFIQRRPCPSGIHHPTSSSISTVLLSTAVSHQPPLPAKACGYGSNTFQPFTSRCPGVPLRAHSPHPFVPAREFFAISGRRHGAREEGVSASRWDRGKAGTCQPSFHPDPSPEQLHILPGALRDPESPALSIPLLPAAPSSPAPRGHSLHLPAAAPGPWIYTCRRAALPWPAGRPPHWPP